MIKILDLAKSYRNNGHAKDNVQDVQGWVRMGDGTKPGQLVSAIMNVPTEDYLDVVEHKEENSDDLMKKHAQLQVFTNCPKENCTSCPLAKCILYVSLEN